MSNSPNLLLDENLSWRVARGLKQAGYQVITTKDLGLNGLHDVKVFRQAQEQQCVIITRDGDFLKDFAPPHYGIIVLRCADTANNTRILQKLLSVLPELLQQELVNSIQSIIVE